MTRADRAEELIRQVYNCSHSVFTAYAAAAGMTEAEAAKIASPTNGVAKPVVQNNN